MMAARIAFLLVLYNNLNNLIPESLHDLLYVPMNVSVALLLVVWGRRRGYSWQALGLSSGRVPEALRWGVPIGVLLPLPVLLTPLLPDSFGSIANARDWDQVAIPELAYQTLVRIPLGTALLEEVAFRGVLFGVLAETAGVRRAVVGSSIAFGLWHIAPTLELLDASGEFGNPGLLAFGVVAGVATTFVGGLFFAWLKIRTGSVYGPMLTHWLINALAAVAAYSVV